MGIYVFEPRVLTYIPYNQNLDLPALVKILISAGEKVIGFPYKGYWQDLGRPDDYENATRDFDSMRTNFLPED
jgi:NDP-sugar pyrophosphorylase family protein